MFEIGAVEVKTLAKIRIMLFSLHFSTEKNVTVLLLAFGKRRNVELINGF